MTPEEMDILMDIDIKRPCFHAQEYMEGTLLYGYTFNRETVHIYSEKGQIVRVDYTGRPNTPSFPVELISVQRFPDRVPCGHLLENLKRAYPDQTRLDFAIRAKQEGFPIIFTSETGLDKRLSIGSFMEGAYIDSPMKE